MKSNISKLNRRDFLAKSGLVGTGLVLGAPLFSFGQTDRLSNTVENDNIQINSNLKNKTDLRTRKLGELEVSELGLGCMNIAWAYGNSPGKEDSVKLIRNAYEYGIRFFDTAEIYGPHISEQIVGEALQPFRDEVVLASKFGFDIDFETGQLKGGLNSRPQHIKLAVDRMLKRLKTDRIDLLYQHRVDPTVPIEDVAGTMGELIKEGKVRYYGLSEAGAATIRRAHKEHKVTAIQNEFSFWTRDPEAEVIPVCEELGIGFVPWSPLGMGYLTGKVTSDFPFAEGDIRKNLNFPRFTTEALVKNRPIVTLLENMAQKYEATSGQIALAWLMAKKPFIVPIPGIRSITHMRENTDAHKVILQTSDIDELESGFAAMEVFGNRAPEGLKASHDIGTSLGTSSKGTNGKTPLPDKIK
ncbi:aldo/keto reductase [Macellibacteroides fermentans]|uniref:Tat (Twin-arginine translocation) pathway signal sequence n=1 Tax=Parabacteroides chartae TaxID=1037355 RepID=A0A1T5CJ03_9BACT|nr:aldo/keto reductase [Parabacteroides chartae]SKB59465.1 Tat (twin-arginine translocation) pathway signal sequence [Parabacteroides chartae]